MGAEMKRGVVWVAGALVALGVLYVAAALAAGGKPLKGAVYRGNDEISFQASANGRSVVQFNGPGLPSCGHGFPAAPNWQSRAKIAGGRFKIKWRGNVPAVVSGRFLANGRVKGTITHDQCSGGIVHWSGTAEPDGKGSRYCLDHNGRFPPPFSNFSFTNITEAGTICQAVYAAMNAGKFTSDPPQHYTVFATPGWTCANPSGQGNDFPITCRKATAHFRFFE
jgi:hypothetical protein